MLSCFIQEVFVAIIDAYTSASICTCAGETAMYEFHDLDTNAKTRGKTESKQQEIIQHFVPTR
jgi:hypothetical protein